MDRRVRRRLNNAFSAAYIYQDDLRPVAQLNSNGSIKSMFVYGTKSNVPDLMIQGSNTFRIISDARGSVLYVIRTSNGQIMQQLTYDSWGKVLTDSSPGFQPFGFAGGVYDSTTGLVRFGARDYDASIGRWLNKDPIRHEGGMNLYRYANNDPVNYVDTSGKIAAPILVVLAPAAVNGIISVIGAISQGASVRGVIKSGITGIVTGATAGLGAMAGGGLIAAGTVITVGNLIIQFANGMIDAEDALGDDGAGYNGLKRIIDPPSSGLRAPRAPASIPDTPRDPRGGVQPPSPSRSPGGSRRPVGPLGSPLGGASPSSGTACI